MIDENKLREIIKESLSYAAVLKKLGIRVAGSNLNTLKNNIIKFNIDISHFAHNSKGIIPKNKRDLDELLIESSVYTSGPDLRKRLLKENLLEEKCYSCGLGPIWDNKPLTLQLHHINGNRYDNRLENLTLLCPNCHTQTETHSGKRFKIIHDDNYKPQREDICPQCNTNKKAITSKFCLSCYKENRYKNTVKHNIDINELTILIKTDSLCSIGRKYGVTNSAVKKWLKEYNLYNTYIEYNTYAKCGHKRTPT